MYRRCQQSVDDRLYVRLVLVSEDISLKIRNSIFHDCSVDLFLEQFDLFQIALYQNALEEPDQFYVVVLAILGNIFESASTYFS